MGKPHHLVLFKFVDKKYSGSGFYVITPFHLLTWTVVKPHWGHVTEE